MTTPIQDTIAELADQASRQQFGGEIDASDVDVDNDLAVAWFAAEMKKQSPQQLLADMVCELTDAEAADLFVSVIHQSVTASQKTFRDCVVKFIATDIARDANLEAVRIAEAATHSTKCRCRDCAAEYGEYLYQSRKDDRITGGL